LALGENNLELPRTLCAPRPNLSGGYGEKKRRAPERDCRSLHEPGAPGERDLLEQLEAISTELMAKAVELDTERDRNDNAGKPSSS
jgi:hypothetical protein